MKALMVLVLMASVSYATEVDDYFGHYAAKVEGHSLEFDFGDSGVTRLSLDGRNIRSTVEDDVHGIYGSSMFLTIRYRDSDSSYCSIRTLILVMDGKFVQGVGDFIKTKVSDKGRVVILDKFVFSLRQKGKKME